MDYMLIPGSKPPIVECNAGVLNVRDAMALVFACNQADTDLSLINGKAFPDEFFDLRTGFAGEFVQRLVNSRLRTAAIFSPDLRAYSQRFQEFLLEARSHPQFRAFDSRTRGLEWLATLVAPASAA